MEVTHLLKKMLQGPGFLKDTDQPFTQYTNLAPTHCSAQMQFLPGLNKHCHTKLAGKQAMQMVCCVFIDETVICCHYSAGSELVPDTFQVRWWYHRIISVTATLLFLVRLTLQLKPEVRIFQLGDCSNANFFRINRVHSLKFHILFKSVVRS